MEHGLTKMARQTTLFGTDAKKDKFFKELDSPGEDDDGCYAVVEALWTVEMSNNRSAFFTKAQKQWMETFSADPQARSEIIQKANSLRAKDGQKLGSSIFAQTSTSADTPKSK